MKRQLFACLAAIVLLTIGSLRASDQVGIYALLTKVVLESKESKPTSVQLWGAFTFAAGTWGATELPPGGFGDPASGDTYGPVQVGYLYYSCGPQPGAIAGLLGNDVDARCFNEWSDLQSVAGTGRVVGFGARRAAKGRVRLSTERPTTPDVFPISQGVVPIGFEGGIPWNLKNPPPPRPHPRPYERMIQAMAAALEKKR